MSAKLISIIISLLLGLSLAQASFPSFAGKTLDDSDLSFPEAFTSDYTLLVFLLEQGQEADAKSWEDYLLELQASTTSFVFYQVFLLENFNFLLKAIISNAMRGEYSEAMKARSMPLYSDDLEAIKEALDLQETSTIHLLLIHEGLVVWRSSELWSEAKAGELEAFLP